MLRGSGSLSFLHAPSISMMSLQMPACRARRRGRRRQHGASHSSQDCTSDRQAVLETLADVEDAGDVPVRDKIVEGLMHRFEVYAPYRRQMAQLENAARRDPAFGLRLIDSLVQAMRMLLRMAGDDLTGVRGEARVRGVAGVAMLVARSWQADDTPDLSATLKEIDRRLTTAEEWGRTLRVLDSDVSQDDPPGAGPESSDDPLDGNPGSRYQ